MMNSGMPLAFARVAYRRRRNGFTLIEMLVVMSIVAMLLTLALPRYFGSLGTARETVLKENLQTMRRTIDKFYADKGRYPDRLEELVESQYLRAVPVDPITESNSSWIILRSRDPDKKGIVDIQSGAVGKTKEGLPYASL